VMYIEVHAPYGVERIPFTGNEDKACRLARKILIDCEEGSACLFPTSFRLTDERGRTIRRWVVESAFVGEPPTLVARKRKDEKEVS